MSKSHFPLVITADNGSVRTGVWFSPKDVYEIVEGYLADGYTLEELEFEK